jgi:hypothetical protein
VKRLDDLPAPPAWVRVPGFVLWLSGGLLLMVNDHWAVAGLWVGLPLLFRIVGDPE